MKLKRDISTKILLLCGLTLIFYLGLVLTKIEINEFNQVFNSETGGRMEINFIGPVLIISTISCVILMFIVEPIHNLKYKAIMKNITIENISDYKVPKKQVKELFISKSYFYYPKMFLPKELVNNHVIKTINCNFHCYSNGFVIRALQFPEYILSNEYDFLIPYDQIKSVNKLKQRILIIDLINDNKILLIFNKNQSSFLHTYKNLNHKLENKLKDNEKITQIN